MDWAARRSGDQLLPPMVDYIRSAALGRIGEHHGATALLTRAIATVAARGDWEGAAAAATENALNLEPVAANDATVLAVLGALHMKLIGVYGAVSDSDRVRTHAAEVARIAELTGPDRVVLETTFGPTNVALHELSAAIDMADTSRAIESLYQASAVAPIHFVNSAVVKGSGLRGRWATRTGPWGNSPTPACIATGSRPARSHGGLLITRSASPCAIRAAAVTVWALARAVLWAVEQREVVGAGLAVVVLAWGRCPG